MTSEFTLPSGRVVKLRSERPTYGELVHCTSLGLDKGTEAFTYARYKIMVPGLKRKQIKALNVEDGSALGAAVLRVWQEEPNGHR